MTTPFVGPWPSASVPEQPTFHGQCVAWTAFDVPRIWDIVATENSPRGWEQVNGFRQLADLLVDHHRRLNGQHFELAHAWQSPAADEMLQRVGTFAESLLSDAHCAQSTAYALHNIMTTYAEARTKIGNIHTRWDNVTTDWIPEWWDHAAEELNNEAQAIMIKTDEAVRDYRKRILAPRTFGTLDDDISISISDGSVSTSLDGSPLVPPVPGYYMWANGSVRSGADTIDRGPALTSWQDRGYIPAVPGQPVSMLPVPPESQYAPIGGAYVLPGPGVGRGGYVISVPAGPRHPSIDNHSSVGSGRESSYRRGVTQQPTSSGPGLVPTAVGTGPQSSHQSGRGLYRRSNIIWKVEEGVPPVIEAAIQDGFDPSQVGRQPEDAFKEWFAELAYPWRSGSNTDPGPQIILRKIAE